MPLLLIARGGAAGATTRYLVDTWISERAGGAFGSCRLPVFVEIVDRKDRLRQCCRNSTFWSAKSAVAIRDTDLTETVAA